MAIAPTKAVRTSLLLALLSLKGMMIPQAVVLWEELMP
jgi:hypothetical protein